jgi:hypothetical protein
MNASNSPSCPNAKVFGGLETIFGLYGSNMGMSTVRRGPNTSKTALSIDSLGFILKQFVSNLLGKNSKPNKETISCFLLHMKFITRLKLLTEGP